MRNTSKKFNNVIERLNKFVVLNGSEQLSASINYDIFNRLRNKSRMSDHRYEYDLYMESKRKDKIRNIVVEMYNKGKL